MRFSEVEGWLKTPSELHVADLDQVTLPAERQLPDLARVVHEFRFDSHAYAALNEGNGQLVGKVFLSHDNTVRYLFFEDMENRVVMSSAESTLPEINQFGLRSRYLAVDGMDAPLIEYRMQIPERFGGERRDGYCSNWPYVQEQPIIKLYLRQRQPEVPSSP
jgi:hypothetical protein